MTEQKERQLSEADSVREIKGVGEKTALLLEKVSIYTVRDLIHYYPRSYDCFEAPVCIQEARTLDFAAIQVTILSHPLIRQTRHLKVVSTTVMDTAGEKLYVTWFQMVYLKNTLKPGMKFVLRGKLSGFGPIRTMEQPKIYTLAEYDKNRFTLQPVYPLIHGLTNGIFTRSIAQAMEHLTCLRESLPEEILEQFHLMDLRSALSAVHFPSDDACFQKARRRIVFEEFFQFIVGVRQLKASIELQKNHFQISARREVEELIQALPYTLTGAQMRTFQEVSGDLCGEHSMNRLIQGDVGSGKTIVAFLAMYQTALCGYQSVLMAPTEVLAVQHFQSFSRMAETYHLPVSIVLLTGSMRAAEKREGYRKIRSGEANLIIGTHALIQEKVEYASLALAVTDEQHRFGVKQRKALEQKGVTPHVLVMSATPIPRSLAIIIYGDLDISVMNELPAKRLPIKNCVVPITYRPKAWEFIRKEVFNGHQAYVICPMVEESENMEGADVVSYSEQLREVLPDKISVSYLHGKMKNDKKEEIMRAFGRNEIQVLVSTTVIEVGIDVPNATVILIENADRFGLAQLHQLRGRVGRGEWQSYCIMVNTSSTEESKQRLEVLNHSNDGFYIASEDLKLRGPGDFFGIRQSGVLEFSLADIYTDHETLEEASAAAERYLKQKESDDCWDWMELCK